MIAKFTSTFPQVRVITQTTILNLLKYHLLSPISFPSLVKERVEILRAQTANFPLSNDVDIDRLAIITIGFVWG